MNCTSRYSPVHADWLASMVIAQIVTFFAALLATLLVPFTLLVNLHPVQRLMLFLAGTIGGPAARFPASEAVTRVSDLLALLAWRRPLPNDGFYTAIELAHMSDVLTLFQTTYGTCVVSFIVLVLLSFPLHRRNLLWRPLRAAGIAILAIAGLLGVFLLTIGFDTVFTVFHELAFANDLWLLPEESSLIRLFPEQYFATYFFAALASSVAIAVVLTTWKRRRR
jgi:hypothetical protein